MNMNSKKRGFLTIDLVTAIAVFSILAMAAITIIVSYEKNILRSQRKQEMNFYIESIAKEIKYNILDSDFTNIKHKYINREEIMSNKIENEELMKIIASNINDNNYYIEINLDDDKMLYIKYVNNKMGVQYSDEEKIKLT